MLMEIKCFKAYDVRGRIPDELNNDVAYRIGNATAKFLDAQQIVLGRDIRLSSAELAEAVSAGITDSGCNVIDIGLGGTEMVYFATGHLEADGGIMVTASHNPADYNGLKIVRRESRPVSADSGLMDIRTLAECDDRLIEARKGEVDRVSITAAYCKKLLGYVDLDKLQPLKIVVNPGNGGAGLIVDELESNLPFDFVKIHHEPDGDFPNGVPNPMLEENRKPTIDALAATGADFGIAWDGDFDRCFFFDENGRFIEGYYVVGLLAESQLADHPNSAIIYDPRLTWNTIETVSEHGGRPVQSKSGHSFIKEVMRREDAIYGGEMSAHHYFRDFYYCDSGMIPWLLVAQIISEAGQSFSSLVDDCMARYPSSGEINRRVPDTAAAIEYFDRYYRSKAISVDNSDGISMEFDTWRYNLRASNTEPVIRLNVESRGDVDLMRAKTEELLHKLDSLK
ncbi:MAG: phosphomannomutase [Woeseia sp.]|nr:phosphomannomutase [Woeseia sp.]